MADLQQFSAKICYTAAAFLIHDKKILLVKHKKLGFWLAPGGHVEPEELMHIAAERECLEETGIKVRARDRLFSRSQIFYNSEKAEYVPSPFVTNLHWVSETNYQSRMTDPASYKPIAPWLKGCEQHLGFSYLVEPVEGVEKVLNDRESDGLEWFELKDIKKLETTDDIRFEIEQAFRLAGLA